MKAITAPPAGPSTFLSGARRARELTELCDGPPVDVLVIGGGVTGAGVALDAVTRGLSVALVERADLASGTSSCSSKLAHGGLRYLAQGQLDVAWESARERHLLASVTAPHLIRALPQLTPIYGGGSSRAQSTAIALGLHGGDAMRIAAGTSSARVPRMRRTGVAESRLWAPALSGAGLRGGLLSWDAQLEDDVRLVVALARTAAGYGARILTRCEVTRVTGDGATLRDGLGGGSFDLRAHHVVNAAGVWAARLANGISLRPSRGSHLLIDSAALGHPRAMVNVPLPREFGRFVFSIPRPDGLTLIGLTDEPVSGPAPDRISVPAEDRRFLIESYSRLLELPLSESDVVGSFAGMRPLLDSGGSPGQQGHTAAAARRHAVIVDPDSAVISVVGGKLTTYRRMAQDAVDVIAGRARVQVGPCRTSNLALVGAGAVNRLAAPAQLIRRFGSEAAEIARLGDGRPDLLRPVLAGSGVLGVELLAATQREGALDLADVVDRRARLGLRDAQRDTALRCAGEILESELYQQSRRDPGIEVGSAAPA